MRALLLSVLLISISSSIDAQSPQTASIQFRTLAWSGVIDDIYFNHKGKDTPIRALDFMRSEFYQADIENGSFQLYQFETNSEGLQVRRILATVKTDTLRPPLLLLLNQKTNGTLQCVVSSDSNTDFPPGSVRFVNMSTHNMGFQLGTKKAMLEPGTDTTLKANASTKTGKMEVRAAALTSPPRHIYSSVWRLEPNNRKIVFAIDTDISTRPVALKSITENAIWKHSIEP